eukprot:TRINITY_DN11721_c0_g1_i1.p1 TRINITY_DN11721_c0_g1~~TRINITY_DN11721_c0_g1_i1.p1  ORF type:complete len:358 (-),score=79.78 TRINITY_DN11721_c0_g1_i1:126-1199(-)
MESRQTSALEEMEEDCWNSWALTEAPAERGGGGRRRSTSSRPSACSSRVSSARRRSPVDGTYACGSTSSSRRSTPGGTGTCFSARGSMMRGDQWYQQELQSQMFSQLAVPKRQRLVEATMSAVRGAFDPAEGLEAAAAAAAAEVLTRTAEEQKERCSDLSKRAAPSLHSTPTAEASLQSAQSLRPRPSFEEQSRRCSELARPRQPRHSSSGEEKEGESTAAGGSDSVAAVIQGADRAQQDVQSSRLAKPRLLGGKFTLEELLYETPPLHDPPRAGTVPPRIAAPMPVVEARAAREILSRLWNGDRQSASISTARALDGKVQLCRPPALPLSARASSRQGDFRGADPLATVQRMATAR